MCRFNCCNVRNLTSWILWGAASFALLSSNMAIFNCFWILKKTDGKKFSRRTTTKLLTMPQIGYNISSWRNFVPTTAEMRLLFSLSMRRTLINRPTYFIVCTSDHNISSRQYAAVIKFQCEICMTGLLLWRNRVAMTINDCILRSRKASRYTPDWSMT